MKNSFLKIIILALLATPLVSSAVVSVATHGATNVTTSSASVSGLVFSFDGVEWAKFRYSAINVSSCDGMSDYEEIPAIVGAGGIGGYYPISGNLSGLNESTTYYFCAIANSLQGGVKYGQVLSFTTQTPPPPPPNQNPSGVTGTGNIRPFIKITHCEAGVTVCAHDLGAAALQIQVSATDTSVVFTGTAGPAGDASYFRYSTMTKPPVFCNDIYGTNMNYTPDLPGSGGSITVTGLRPNTIYYYCFIASNEREISHGRTGHAYSFRTDPCKTCEQTTVETWRAYVLSPTTALIRGQFGSTKESTAYFEYKEKEGGSWIEVAKNDPDNPYASNSYVKYSFLLQELEADTEYSFRAVVENEDGLFYGNVLDFKTLTANQFGDYGGWVYGDPSDFPDSSNPSDPLDPPDDPPQCPQGYTGTYPNCVGPQTQCPPGFTGTYPNCTGPQTQCPTGYTGTYPNCVEGDCDDPGEICDPEDQCPAGFTGTPPNCVGPQTQCPQGYTGTYPNCVGPQTQCPPGFTGTYPNCVGAPNSPNNPFTPYNPITFGGTPPSPPGNTSAPTSPPAFSPGEFAPYEPSEYGGNPGNFGNNSNDIDDDGIPNYSDEDSDGDGVPNINDNDDDNDGILDPFDPTPLGPGSTGNDLDGDGIPNSIDNDDDNDGTPDTIDRTPFGAGSNPNDLDGDGINNLADGDVDGDGISNDQDLDDDNDGALDENDPTPRGAGSGAGTGLDKDQQEDEPIGSVEGVSTENISPASALGILSEGITANEEITEKKIIEQEAGSRSFLGRLMDKLIKLIK